MKNNIFRMLRTCVAMMLVVVMLVSSVASAATLTLPKAIKTISEEAFMGDTSVENVVIPNGATSIGARAFKGCTNLKTVQIPDSVQSIGVDAFDGCDGVTIICSSTSEAAKYAADYDYIEVQYTDVVEPDPEPEFDVEWTQYIDTMYADSVWAGGTVLYANVAGYDAERDGEIEWELKLKSGESIPFIYNYSPEDQPDQYYVKHMYAAGSNYTGSATYELTVKVGEYTETHEFTVTVTANSGDLPAGIASSNQYYEVGQTMRFVIGDLYFVNEDGSEYTGISMNDSNVYMDNSGIEYYSIWEQGVEWINGEHEGFQVTFTKEGRYEVPVSVHVGNIIYVDSIWITVGSGLPSDDQFVKGACYDTLYVGYDATGNFAAATWFDEFVLYDGESIEWDVKVKEANPDTPVVNVELRETNNGMNAQLFFVGTPSEVGEVTYTVTAVVTIGDSEKAYSHEFTFYVEELPEDAPTNENVSVPKTEYNVMVGEELSFSDADIQLVGAPEGDEWTYEYIKHVESSWMEDETVCTWYEYNEWDGYYITFLKPGTYTLRAEAKINANYSVYKDITIYVRDVAESELDVEWTQYIDTMYIGGNGWMGNLIVRAELSGYDAEQHGEIVWNVECLEGVDVFTYWTVSPEGEENTYQMRLQKAIKAGTAKYRMSVTVGDFTDSYEFTVNVIEAPADLPGGFGVAPQEYDVGDTMEFTIDDLTLLNEDGSAYTGSVKLTDANVHMELFDSSEYAFWNESAEFINGFRGGVKVTFDKSGRYLMPVTLHVCNYIFYVDVIVYVGDGVPSDAFISQYYMYDTLYADTTSEGWLGNAYLDDYPLVSGETVEWSIAADTENPVVIVELGDTWKDDERGIDLFYSGMTGETGNVTYTVTATVKSGDEIIKSYTVDYLVKVVAKPDTLPTDANVAVSKTKYDISLEDTLTFRYDDIQLVNAPEGVEWNWVAEYDGGEWLEGDACLYGYLEDSDNDGREDGIEINFVKEGRYVLKAVANISANYRVYKDIVICVGSSLSEDVYVGSCVHTNTVFNDTDDAWFCNVNLNNFQLAQGEEVEWEIVSKENKGLVELYVNDTWDNTIYANLYVRNVSGELGNESFTVTANVGGYSISTELTVEVIERPDELPDDGAVIVDLDKYEYEVGEEFKFDFDQISIDESVLPEEMKGKWSTDIWDTEQFDWYETGIQTKFEQAGIYSFKAVVRLASDYDISKMVYITVGDVQPVVEWFDHSTRLYVVPANEDGTYNSDLWIGDVIVSNYVVPGDEELVWNFEHISGNASVKAYWYEVDYTRNRYSAGIGAYQTGEIRGEAVWRLTATVGDDVIVSRDFTIELVDIDALDVTIETKQDDYYVKVGEEFAYSVDDFWIAEGSVYPEDAIISEMIYADDLYEYPGADFIWDGYNAKSFRVTFKEVGTYTFQAVTYMDNVAWFKDITVYVIGDKPVENWNDNSTTMYAVEPNENGDYDSDLWITDVQVTGYVAPEGVDLKWEAVRTDGNASIEIEVMPGGEPNDYWCGFHAHQNGDTTGESTWKFIATAGDEVIVEKDYTITLLERDENLHIEIDIETDEYYTNVGEKFVFSCDAEYGITEDSVIREGAIVRKEIIGGTEIAEIEGFEWHDWMTGFDVVFDEPGDYVFTITAYFDNVGDQRDIYVHVIGGEPVVEWKDHSTTMHAVSADKYKEIDLWITDVLLTNYVAPNGVELVWNAECTGGNADIWVEAWPWGGPNYYECGFHAFQTGEQTGDSTWLFTATAGEDVIVSKEYTITLLERDESLNIGIDIEEDEYSIYAGEEFEFTIDNYDITEDSKIREGAEVHKEIYKEWNDSVEFLADYENCSGFKVIFTEAGDYEFSIVAFFDNILDEKVITVHVDDSMWIKADISDPYAVVVDSVDSAAWALDNEWIGRFELMNVAEDEEIEWSVASKDNKNIAVMALDYENAEGNSIGLLVSSECDTVGTETFVVTAKVGEEVITEEFNFEVRNAPDYLPTVEDMYFFESGDTFYINLDDEFTISANDVHLNNVPEDMYCHIVGPNDEGWMYDGNVTEKLYWVEDVLHIKFREPGVYQMNMIAVISSNYYVEKTITIIVSESENQEEFPLSTGVPFDTLYVYEDNDSKDEWLGDFSVQGYRFEEDTKLDWDAWIHDFSGNGEEGAEPFMDIYLYMQEHLNKGQMSVFCNGMNGNTGWVDVYVKCVVDDTYTFSTIIRYNAEELPEDPMFTNEDVYVEGYEDYTINLDVNEGYTLNKDEICLQNADDSVYWEPHIHDVGWDEDTAYVEWRDEGVYIEFHKEGTYKIKAVAKVEANCYLYREIKLVVGSGVSSDAYIDWGLNADRLFIDENASAENAIYFKDAYLVDTGVDEEDSTVTWSIESKNGEGFATLEMKQNSWDPCVFDNGIYVTGFNGEEGTETFIVTASVNDVEVSEEIEIQIMNMPEDMPTAEDIRVSNDNYVVYVGDYFEFMDHNFGFDDGSIPEGMDYVFDIWNMEELLEKNEGEFHGNGISVTFTQAGEYSFDAMARFGGGYEIGKTINITVIDGLRANWYGTMYIHEGDTAYNSQLAYVWVDGFEKNYEEGATVTWDAKIVNYGNGEEPFMSVFVEECNSGDANLKCGGMTGKTGWVEVEITCTVNGTDTYTRVIGFNAEYVTDEMPTEDDIWVESEDYYVNVGATFEYWAHKHGLNDGFGCQRESEIHGYGDPWAIEQMESFEWLEGNGFRVTFEEVGDYKFNAAVKIGANHWISRTITVHVMDLLTIRGTTMYEGKGDLWVADAYIFDYVNSEGANVEWSITPVLGEDQTECIELYFANENDGVDTIYRMISATQIENATPVIDVYTFKIKAWAGKDVLINENITVSLEEAITPTFDISVAQEVYNVGIGQEFFYSYANFGFTEDSQFPDGANKVKEVSIPDDMWETWVNNGFEWTYDENDIRSFRVAFKEAGTYTFTVTVLVNNWPISKKITLNVDDMSTVRWDDHADRMYKNSGDDMWVTDVYIENYYLDDEIVWTLEPAEDQENPCIELYFVESFSTNTRRGIHANQLTEDTGSVTYNLTAVAADGSKVFINEDITVYLEDRPEDFVLNIWADSDIYNVAVGEEFVYTADKFGVDAENSNYPEGEHVSCEIWADDISNKYGRDFEWQDDDGFKVKFDQPGRYAFTVAVCVRNVYVTAPITIIVGDGPSLNAYVESDEVFADFEGDTWFGNVGFDNFFFSDGENIEWSCDYISQNIGETPIAELYVHDIWENGLGANINVCNLTGETGEATYKVTANCGNHSWEKEITVKVIARPEEELPGNDAITVPAELINLDVGTKFSYSLEDFSFDDSTLPEGLKYMKLLWPSDVIGNMESFSSDENGFSVTFNEEGRYEFDAVVKITADYIINKTVVIVVGDGIRGDAEPYIEEVCSFGPIYPGMGDSYYGCWELMGYDILNSDEVKWTVERYTDDYSPETPGVKMRVSWVSYDRYMADLNTYDVIEQYDTEEYDMICNVNGVEIARYRVYVTVAELTEDVPTDLWVNCDTYYVHAGDEFTFTYNECGPNGNIPEGADVRYEVWVADDLRNQAGYKDLDNGFTLTPAVGEYVFTAACWIGNYAATRDITIVVYEGDWYVDWNDNGEDSVFEMYPNLGDMNIVDAYIHGYDKPEGAEIVWTAEYKDEDAKVVDIKINLNNDNRGAIIYASYANEDHSITGADTYEIVAKAVIGETETELGRHEVKIHVIEEPENMPTELWVNGDEHIWHAGDWFTFTTEMFDLNNGEVPAGAATRKEIWINDDLRGQNGFEEFDGGFKVCVQNDGTYIFTAVYVINNRYITRDISLVVYSGDKYIRWNDNTDAVTEEDTFEMYMNADGQMWVTDCGIIGYEKPENTDIEWYLDYKGGSKEGNADDQVVKLYINGRWNENYDCQINAERLQDEIGWAKYDIVAVAGETELVRRTVTIKVAEIPADIPANEERVQIESNEYYLNVGQSFDYHVDKIGLDYDGDVQWYPEIHGWGDPWAIEQIESFKWTDNGKGFSVTFDEEGEYKFFAAVRFGGNYYLRKEITITVMEKFDVISTTMYNGVGDLWVADAYIFDYALPENTVSEWSMEPVLAEGQTECPLELYFEQKVDSWYVYRMITATQKEGVEQVNGVYTFEIKAWVGEDVLLEETVTVNLVDPATLTFDVKADAYEYTVGVGEEFRYSYNSFGFSDDTVIPDGASKIKQVQCSEELMNCDSLEGTMDEDGTRGFKVTFDEPGVYTFDVVMRINNWPKSKTVTINVTPYGYASVNWSNNGDTLYAIEGNTHGIGAAYLENYYIEEGDSISWSVNVTEGRNLCNVVIPKDNEYWDDGRGVNLHFTDFTGETGTLKFTLTVTTEAGFTESREFVYEVVAKPETLPTGIDVGQTEYNIEPGDSITIELKNLEYTGGNVPEEGFWNYSYVDANGNDMSWDDEQKKAVLTFHNEGRYWFKVSANINNYQLEQVITVNVGITEQNYTVDYYQAFTQLYAGVTPVNDYGCWGGNMQIMNYQVLPDETLTWSLTETYRDEGVTAELFFDVEDLSKNSLANIECRNVGTGIGKVSYEVEVVSSKGFTATRTFEFTVVANPGNLPKTLTVPFESYTVPAGSLITIRYDKFSVDGEKPEDFRYSIEGVGELPFEGRFAGDDITTPHRLHLKPEGTGTYTIRAQAICGNYVIEKNISITVTGYTQKYQDSEKLFIGDSEYLDDDFWAGLVSMVDFELQDGEEILWNVCRISGDENVELDLYMVEGNEPEIMNVYCNNVGAATGNVKYEVTGASNMGYSVSYEFDFSVENLPEGLPTELYVPNTTYELKANEVCEIWYKDFSVNAEMPEGAHFYIDVTNLPDTKYYAGQGDEERLYMEPNAAGTYVIEAQMIYGNYVIGTPITIIVTE